MSVIQEMCLRSGKFKNLPDEQTKNAVLEYLDPYSANAQPYACIRALTDAMIPGVPLSEYTTEKVLAEQERWNVGNGHRKHFVGLLIYGCKNGIIADERIARLLDFESHLSFVYSDAATVPYILQDESYDRFKESDLIENLDDQYSSVIYRFVPDIADLEPISVQASVIDFCEDVKFSTQRNLHGRYMILWGVNKIIPILFKNGTNLTSSAIMNCIDAFASESKYMRTIYNFSIIGLTIGLCHRGQITDENVKCLAAMEGEVFNSLPIDTIREILTRPYPERWIARSFDTARGRTAGIRYINCANPEIRETIASFLCDYYQRTGGYIPQFLDYFDESLQGCNVACVDDFNFITFKAQTSFYAQMNDGRYATKEAVSTAVSFYVYLSQTVNSRLFEVNNVPTEVLHRAHIVDEILNGFNVINYNKIEPVPTSDKWLLCYKNYDRDVRVLVRLVDFTAIESDVYREWFKSYVWNADTKMNVKIADIMKLAPFFNYLSDIKAGKVLSFYNCEPNESRFSTIDAAAYHNRITELYSNNRTQNNYIYSARNIITFVDRMGLGEVDSGAFYNLTHPLDSNYDNTKPIPREELQKLAIVVKKRAESDVISDIYSSIFFLALETEFRGSQIYNLDKNCLQETSKKGEYVVVSETKTSANELIEQPVTTYVVKEIQHTIAVTEQFRSQCTDTRMLGKLFIVPGRRRGTFSLVTPTQFNNFMASCCKEAGTGHYSIQNLRDTHMTKAEETTIRRKLTEMEHSVLSGHRSSVVDDIHYVRLSIREMLEAVHGVIIGEVSLDGTIRKELDESIANDRNEVSHGCGYCGTASCGMLTNLDCLMCKNFVTTISRLPYFEEEIKRLDAKIEAATIPHDKEDCVNIKRLILRYIEEIMALKKEVENGGQ